MARGTALAPKISPPETDGVEAILRESIPRLGFGWSVVLVAAGSHLVEQF